MLAQWGEVPLYYGCDKSIVKKVRQGKDLE